MKVAFPTRRLVLRMVLPLAVLMPVPAAAQVQTVQRIPSANDPVTILSGHLRTLATQPRNLAALLGAGQAAIDVGDPNAAIGFFARAEEVDSRNGRAKAGLATALVMMERADDALKLFGEAVSLGVPERDIARDRGLAYDLRGDSKRAQRDYALALQRGADDEVTRRYALSLGISGDKTQAMAMLDPLLRKQDQGAWRARAFILAMNGDVTGANAIARAVMPANLAGTMSPFLTRLATLNAADRAHAVNFGTVPSNGQNYAVQTGDPFKAVGSAIGGADNGLIPAGDPFGPRAADVQVARKAEPLSREPRRRPGQEVLTAVAPSVKPGFTAEPAKIETTQRIGTRVGTRIAAIDPARLPPEARGISGPPVLTKATELPAPDTRIVKPPVQIAVVTPRPAPVFETAPVKVVPTPSGIPVNRLASILAGVQLEAESVPAALPNAAELRAAKKTAAKKAADAAVAAKAEKAAKDAKAAELAAARANPTRTWVQVATGNNEAGLAATWKRIREGNAKLLKGLGGYSMPFKATNRVLAGPVKPAEARTIINGLAKVGVQANSFTSEAGQEVVKLAAK